MKPNMENTTVIIGSGIIGLSTAYYLSSSESESKPHNIHLVESSPELFRCSSGFAGGFLAENCTTTLPQRACLLKLMLS